MSVQMDQLKGVEFISEEGSLQFTGRFESRCDLIPVIRAFAEWCGHNADDLFDDIHEMVECEIDQEVADAKDYINNYEVDECLRQKEARDNG